MTLTKQDITTIRKIVHEETSNDFANLKTDITDLKNYVEYNSDDINNNIQFIQKNMLTKDDAKNFLTKEDATNFLTKDEAKDLSHYTANLVMEEMRDQFRAFNDKFLFTSENINTNKSNISENLTRIDINSMKILHNSNRLSTLET